MDCQGWTLTKIGNPLPPQKRRKKKKKKEDQQREEHVLHPLGTPGPVAVMEIKPLALENKGTHAILKKEKKSVRK